MANRTGFWGGILVGALAGAIAMYLLDPDRGRRRRAIVVDKVASGWNRVTSSSAAVLRGARWRLKGVAAEARRTHRTAEEPDELRLIERVRARIGRVVGNPHAIQVGAYRGRVTLSGPVLRAQAGALVAATRAVSGVSDVDDHLVQYEDADSVPSLQGAALRSRARSSPGLRVNPALRTAAIAGAGVLLLTAFRFARRSERTED